MNDWIDVFKTGTHTDMAGVTRTWTEADLDKIVAASKDMAAPAVIGHPKIDAPAWGWVDEVKKEAGRIWVKFSDLVPEFSEMVKKKMFPNRSIALNPDFSIRHIGFLGAVPPAVKGLGGIKFSDSEAMAVIEFAEHSRLADRLQSLRNAKGLTVADLARAGGIDESTMSAILGGDIKRPPDRRLRGFSRVLGVSFDSLRSLVGEEFSEEEGDLIDRVFNRMKAFFISEENNPKNKEESMSKTFTEAELNEKLNTQKTEYASQITSLEEGRKKRDDKIAKMEADRKTEQAETRKQNVSSFCEGLKKDGHLLPAWEKMGLATFMEQIEEMPTEIEFSEGKKETPGVFFRRFLSELPKVVTFKEIAAHKDLKKGAEFSTDGKIPVDQDRLELHNKVVAYRQEHKDVTYEDAVTAVS